MKNAIVVILYCLKKFRKVCSTFGINKRLIYD